MQSRKSALIYGPRTQHSMEMGEVLTFAGIQVTSVNLRLEDALAPPAKTWGNFLNQHCTGNQDIVLSDGAFFAKYLLLPQAVRSVKASPFNLIVMEQIHPLSFNVARATFDLADQFGVRRFVTVVRPRPEGDPNALAVPASSTVMAFAKAGWSTIAV